MREAADMAAFRRAPLGLLVATLAAAAINTVLLARYPAAMHLDGSGPLLVALGVGLCSAVGVAVTGLVVRAPLLRTAARLGSRWGVVFGALWVLEMTVANEWYGQGAWRLVPYFGSIFGVLVLNVLAGALAAHRYRRIAAGSLVGLWAGLVSGLVGLATMQLQVLLTLPALRADPQNIAEAAHAHAELTTHIVGEQVTAGVSHLIVVGMIAGTALATLGALVGRVIPTTSTAAPARPSVGPG
jgi:hypothetical protein